MHEAQVGACMRIGSGIATLTRSCLRFPATLSEETACSRHLLPLFGPHLSSHPAHRSRNALQRPRLSSCRLSFPL